MNRQQMFNTNRVVRADSSEQIAQRLYDHALYPAAGVQRIVGFALPQGQGITTAVGAVVGSAKTVHDTNMDLGGQLPNGKVYLCESIEINFVPGASAVTNTFTLARPDSFLAAAALTLNAQIADAYQFYNSGALRFNVLNKVQLAETPLMVFPPKVNFVLDGFVSTNSATTAALAAVSAKAGGRPYFLTDYAIQLQSSMNFDVTLEWPTAVPLPSGFNARVGIILDGVLGRASQ
jgi:hypothetical protein